MTTPDQNSNGEQLPRQLSDDQRISLIINLESALLVAPKKRSVDMGLFFAKTTFQDQFGKALPELKLLLETLMTIPAVSHFDNARQFGIDWEHRCNMLDLFEWLIARGQQVGAHQSIADLERYLVTDSIELTTILAVNGIHLSDSVALGNYTLVPWEQVQLTDTKWWIQAKNLYGGSDPTAAVLCRDLIKPIHLRPWDVTPIYVPKSIEPMIDILRCVTTVSGAGYQLLHFWREPPEWAPWFIKPSQFGYDGTIFAMPVELNSDTSIELQRLCEKFSQFDEISRQRFRIPMDRLNKSVLEGIRFVDAAIELGVALESFYVPSKSSDSLTHLVRTRAAKFLGGDTATRHKTADLLNDVYDLRSRAVHGGRFDADGKKTWKDDGKIYDVLERGRVLVRQSIQKAILEGEPKWKDLDLGIEEPETTEDTQN
jgi:Apea-like HEPN